MRYRKFGRTGWQVSEVGYGMWGLAGWTGSDDDTLRQALQLAVDLGCNFFDTAWAYGDGHSERFLGELLRANSGKKLYTATKIPPKNRQWPTRRGDPLVNVFPPDYIREYTEKSLANLKQPAVDLMQFHVWEDDWAEDKSWQRAVDDLKRQKLVKAVGVSINRWEPWNALRTVRTGLIDSVQVIYNIFDQAPEDELFPLCRERGIGVIARVPFDEGTLTGTLTKETRWPANDWRNSYFVHENLIPSVERCRCAQAAGPGGNDHAGDGPALHSCQPGRWHDHPRYGARRPMSVPTSAPVMPVPCRPSFSPNSASTAGTASRQNGRSSGFLRWSGYNSQDQAGIVTGNIHSCSIHQKGAASVHSHSRSSAGSFQGQAFGSERSPAPARATPSSKESLISVAKVPIRLTWI